MQGGTLRRCDSSGRCVASAALQIEAVRSSFKRQGLAELSPLFLCAGIIEAEFFDAEGMFPKNTQPGLL